MQVTSLFDRSCLADIRSNLISWDWVWESVGRNMMRINTREKLAMGSKSQYFVLFVLNKEIFRPVLMEE
ncbi:MAG: hypothetical protein AMS26_19670 [Bacteroides sp. SM23_62]|nr:MAG: hypothetical protein AMS26_19670 [Bacteroides sp. SM23_62]